MLELLERSALYTVATCPSGQGLFCTAAVPAGTTVLPLVGRPTATRGRLTLQVAPGLHLAPDGAAWALTNHACRPSCRVDFARWTLVTARPLAAGEELTWDYLTTEWELAAPFVCRCGTEGCRGEIRGFRFLPPKDRATLASSVSPALHELERLHGHRPAGRTPGARPDAAARGGRRVSAHAKDRSP